MLSTLVLQVKETIRIVKFYTAVILEQGVEILKKYHFKLPIIGNHKLNVYLKAIRDLCGKDTLPNISAKIDGKICGNLAVTFVVKWR